MKSAAMLKVTHRQPCKPCIVSCKYNTVNFTWGAWPLTQLVLISHQSLTQL